MLNSTGQVDNLRAAQRLKAMLGRVYTFVGSVPEHRRRAFLALLEAWTCQGLLAGGRIGERRRHFEIPSSVALAYGTNGNVLKDFIRDISAGGIFIETAERFCEGQQITLVFPSSNTLERSKDITGQVVRTPRRGVGVKFTMVSRALQQTVELL